MVKWSNGRMGDGLWSRVHGQENRSRDACLVAEGAGDHLHIVRKLSHRALVKGVPNAFEEQIGRLHDSSAEDDHSRVEDVDDVRHSEAKVLGGLVHDSAGDGVPFPRGLSDLFGGSLESGFTCTSGDGSP